MNSLYVRDDLPCLTANCRYWVGGSADLPLTRGNLKVFRKQQTQIMITHKHHDHTQTS